MLDNKVSRKQYKLRILEKQRKDRIMGRDIFASSRIIIQDKQGNEITSFSGRIINNKFGHLSINRTGIIKNQDAVRSAQNIQIIRPDSSKIDFEGIEITVAKNLDCNCEGSVQIKYTDFYKEKNGVIIVGSKNQTMP